MCVITEFDKGYLPIMPFIRVSKFQNIYTKKYIVHVLNSGSVNIVNIKYNTDVFIFRLLWMINVGDKLDNLANSTIIHRK